MAKMKDWTSQLSGETRDAFAQMKQEIPLISYTMNRDEMKYTYGASRKQAWETLGRSLIVSVVTTIFLDLLFLIYLLSFAFDTILYAYKVLVPISIMILVVFISLCILQFFLSTKKRPEILVTYSGAYFLGAFYPFRTSNRYLGTASYIEAGEGAPPLLRLTFCTATTVNGITIEPSRIKNDYYIEVPLRPEHVEKITKIIQILLSDSRDRTGEVTPE